MKSQKSVEFSQIENQIRVNIDKFKSMRNVIDSARREKQGAGADEADEVVLEDPTTGGNTERGAAGDKKAMR